MMIQEYGPNSVIVERTIIPAINIRVDGFPAVLDGESVPLYFEIMFEDGDLWEVFSLDNEHLGVVIHENFAKNGISEYEDGFGATVQEFLYAYNNREEIKRRMIQNRSNRT